MKKPLIIANWKMNPTNPREALDLANEIAKGVAGVEAQVVLCPPFVYIPAMQAVAYKLQTTGGKLQFGAQDCFWEEQGPYTGEISPVMLRNFGCTYVLLGHSERRQFGENSAIVQKKIKAALSAGLIPIVCVGEELENNLKIIFHRIKTWNLNITNVVFVYEPVWAISTNSGAGPATPEDVKEAVAVLRAVLKELIGEKDAEGMTVLYGGSVDSNNIRNFLGEDKAQGVLVGNASLQAKEFVALVKNAAMN